MERLWTRSFVLITVGMLFLYIGYYSLMPTLPLFVKQMNGNEMQVGMAMGAFMLSAVVLRPIVGGLLDRFGRRPFMIWGLLLYIVSMVLYDWAAGILFLILLRIFHGMSWAVSTTAVFTSVTDLLPESLRGEGMGWFSMSMTLAMAIGPMFGVWLTQNQSNQALFLVAGGLAGAALVLILSVKIPFKPHAGPGRKKIAFFEKSVMPVSISVIFLTIGYGGITTFVPLFAHSIHVNSGLFFMVYAASLALSRPIAGKLSDWKGESYVIIPALLITMIALLTLSLSTGWIGILLSAILYGIGFGSAQPALQAATLRLAHPERKGVANASYLTATDLGIGVGSIILGWVSQYTSYPVLFVVSAGSIFVSIILFVGFAKRKLNNGLYDMKQ